MKIRVTFHSGKIQDFVVADDILVANFAKIVCEVGGLVRRMEFL